MHSSHLNKMKTVTVLEWYMLYGIEIVSWVDNTAFQVVPKILDEEVEIEL